MVHRMTGLKDGQPACVLLVFIDDATGKLLQLLFVDSESFFSYAQATEELFAAVWQAGGLLQRQT